MEDSPSGCGIAGCDHPRLRRRYDRYRFQVSTVTTVTAFRFPLRPLPILGFRYDRYRFQVKPLRPLPFSGFRYDRYCC